MTERISEPFKTQGGHTQFDNDVLDHLMPKLSPSEWMVLSFIIRKTKGWHKESDGISYSQFINGTGIASNSTIKKCLDSLVGMNLIKVGSTGHRADSHHYMLNRNYSFRITESVERPVTFSVERPVTKIVDTKESIKESVKQTTSPLISAYEQAFGVITYRAQTILFDDDDTYGTAKVLEAIAISKERGAHSYAYVAKVLEGRANELKKVNVTDSAELFQKLAAAASRRKLDGLTEQEKAIFFKVGGVTRFVEAKIGYEYDQLKKEVANAQ